MSVHVDTVEEAKAFDQFLQKQGIRFTRTKCESGRTKFDAVSSLKLMLHSFRKLQVLRPNSQRSVLRNG